MIPPGCLLRGGNLFPFFCSPRQHSVRKPLGLGSGSWVCIFGSVSYYKPLCKFLPHYTKVFLPRARLQDIGPTYLTAVNPMGLHVITAGAVCNVRAINLNHIESEGLFWVSAG